MWLVFVDMDLDGFDTSTDCNDANPAIHPGAVEIPADGVDMNCDGTELCYTDADLDAARSTSTVVSLDLDCVDAGEVTAALPVDCDDADPDAFPGNIETVGDGNDNDCTGTETCYLDQDNDGYHDPAGTVFSNDEDCLDPGEGVEGEGIDCLDTDPSVSPGQVDVCGNGVDDDCDGAGDFDSASYLDDDGDGLTYLEEQALGFSDCDADSDDDGITDDLEGGPIDYDGDGATSDVDCDDSDPTVSPDRVEVCGDLKDQDCDGADEPCDTNPPPTETGAPPGDSGTTGDPPGTPADTADSGGAAKACGCAGTGPAAGWFALLAAPLAVRRRR